MTLKWILFTLLQFKLPSTTLPSIAGVTYMDHFDFEERYRDVNECNPFHWHPLHMPEDCANMYEKLIRSRVAKTSPARIFRNREREQDLKEIRRLWESFEEDVYSISTRDDYEYNLPGSLQSYQIYDLASQEDYKHLPLSPYEKMMAMMKKDVLKEPSAPTVQMLPGLGPVAVYRQPISTKTEGLIKRIAKAYAKANQQSSWNYGVPYSYSALLYNESNTTSSKDNNNTVNNNTVNNKNETKVVRRKLGNGDLVTVLQSNHRPS